MGFLMSQGLRLPRDVTLISRDDSPVLLHMYPAVARYAAKPAFHARKISKAVLSLVRGEVVAATEHKIIPQFIPGESLG
jgi:DNA-binding LacI/PurR family transcriptional regulator